MVKNGLEKCSDTRLAGAAPLDTAILRRGSRPSVPPSWGEPCPRSPSSLRPRPLKRVVGHVAGRTPAATLEGGPGDKSPSTSRHRRRAGRSTGAPPSGADGIWSGQFKPARI